MRSVYNAVRTPYVDTKGAYGKMHTSLSFKLLHNKAVAAKDDQPLLETQLTVDEILLLPATADATAVNRNLCRRECNLSSQSFAQDSTCVSSTS